MPTNISKPNKRIIKRNIEIMRYKIEHGFFDKTKRYMSLQDAIIKERNLKKYIELNTELEDIDLIEHFAPSHSTYDMCDFHDNEYDHQTYLNPAMKGQLRF